MRIAVTRTFVSMAIVAMGGHITTRSAHAQTHVQTQAPAYSVMAPIDQYLIPSRATEIALARSAAPASISGAAEVMVLDRNGHSTVVKGTNGFVCLVERSSKRQYVNDNGKAWHPHLMFFVAGNSADGWGANRDGVPVLATNDPDDRLTVMLVSVAHWSDGTAANKT